MTTTNPPSSPPERPTCAKHCEHDLQFMTGDPAHVTERKPWCMHEDEDGFCGHVCSPPEQAPPERIRVVVRAATADNWIGIAYCKDYTGDPSAIHEYVRPDLVRPSVPANRPRAVFDAGFAAPSSRREVNRLLNAIEQTIRSLSQPLGPTETATRVALAADHGLSYVAALRDRLERDDTERAASPPESAPTTASGAVRAAAEEIEHALRATPFNSDATRAGQVIAIITKHLGGVAGGLGRQDQASLVWTVVFDIVSTHCDEASRGFIKRLEAARDAAGYGPVGEGEGEDAE